jgi:predicted transglutaminase-like cysteine proteinase
MTLNRFVKSVILLTSCFAATSAAADAVMRTGGLTTQPVGHYDFCQHHASECRPNAATARAKLTPKVWALLQHVNNAANADIAPVTDRELWGVDERWSYPDARGDCEDYVLLKRRALMERGLPASALLITVARQENGDGHAVLTVRTDRGDFVLDNLEPKVLLWSETGYLYLKRQSAEDAGQWVAISDGRAPMVGSVK